MQAYCHIENAQIQDCCDLAEKYRIDLISLRCCKDELRIKKNNKSLINNRNLSVNMNNKNEEIGEEASQE